MARDRALGFKSRKGVIGILDQINLLERRNLPAGTLSYAEQRALEIGITIAGGANVIMLDEPTAGMSNTETDYITDLILKVTEGKTLIMVEHDMSVVFGLADRIDNYPDQLSGGQQQRVAIVRALALRPEVMLFDEITSALDPQLVGEVLDVLLMLKNQGMTMVLATHEMGFAREAADKVCFLQSGRIIEEGPPEAVFEAPQRPETQAFLARALK